MAEREGNDARLHWHQPEWLDEATGWIGAQLGQLGISVTGEIEQPHARWWSTVLRVPTGEGDVYFKAAAPVHRFEAGLLELLSKLHPSCIPELLAADAGRGWMLTRECGTRLRGLMQSAADLAHWEALLPVYAELQLALVPQVDELLGLGVPDTRLAGLSGSFERLLADDEAILLDRPHGVASDEREQLRALVPEIEAAAERLAGYAIPETLQHDDFHDGNVFVREGRYVFFDWGDSCVSHPFHTLVVTFRAIAHRFELDLRPGGTELLRLRDAYLEPFSRYGSRDDLTAAVDLAHTTGTLARALAWHRFVSARDREFRDDDAEAVPYGLKRLLDLGPIGSWT